MKQKNRKWILIAVLTIVMAVILSLITVWITRNELLSYIVILIVVAPILAWMTYESKYCDEN